ncbi:MAG: winged helix-turn-helix transcriptional regulator [Paracoccaceae bacterium]
MEHLITAGLLERNPGYGHPLRPEFRLTQNGITAAALAKKIQNASAGEHHDLLRRSWTLPVLTAIHTPSRFNDIKRNLHTVTDRALSQSLKSMEDRNWVCRSIDDTARPPRSIYRSVNIGGRISNVTAPEITFG